MKAAIMNINKVLTAGALAGLLAVSGATAQAAATTARQTVPKASFLNYRVDTVKQLIAQVKADPAVRARYAKLFHVPQAQVVSFIQKNLVESYVPASKTYPVWCASKTGRLYVVHQHFAAGTRVFALRNGTPVMKWACGNPLVSMLPMAPIMKTPIARKPQLPSENVAPFNETIVSESTPQGAPAPIHLVESIPGEAASVVPNSLVAGSTELLTPVTTAAGKGFIPWLPIAGGAGLFTSTIGGGGKSPGSIETTDTFGNGASNSVVPEPAPGLTLVLGLLPLAGLIAWRQRNRKPIALRVK